MSWCYIRGSRLFWPESKEKMMYNIYVCKYIHQVKSQEISSAWHLFRLNVPFFPVSLPCHCITGKQKNMFSWMPCGYVQNQERKDKLAQTIATQSELREWRWKQARRAILMLVIAHVYSKYWWMQGFSLYIFIYAHSSMTFGSFGDDSSRPLNCAKGLWLQRVFFVGLYLDPWRKSSKLMNICLWGVEICHLGQRLCSWYVGTSPSKKTG